MSKSAKLTSIDAVERMSTALAQFGEEVAAALDHLDMETKRALQWIGHDRKQYWAGQVRRNRDGVSESRAELERALTYRGVAGQRPACREERAELEKMKRRLHVSEDKTDAVRHWTNAIDHQVLELIASMSQLAQWLQADLPKAQGVLKRLMSSLEAYVATSATTGADFAATASSSVEHLKKEDLEKEDDGNSSQASDDDSEGEEK